MKQGGQQLLLCTHLQGQLGSLQPVPSSRLLLCSHVSITGKQRFVAVLWEANLSMAFASAENYSSSFFKDVNARCLALPGADEDGLPGLGDGR